MKKNMGLIIMCSIVVSLLVGCRGGQTKIKQNGNEVDKQEKVTINFWHHYNAQSAENKVLEEILIPAFEKEHPEIKVKAVSHEWEQLHKKILISSNANQLPDIARSDIAWVPEFQKMDILVPLNKEIKEFNEIANNLLDGPMNTAKIKGDYYGLGLNTNTKILFYNKKMFDKAGIQAPKTIDEFFEYARLLTKKQDGQKVWGYAEPALSGWNICPFIWSNGGDVLSPDYTKATGYLNSEQNVEIIQKLADLYKQGVMTGFNSGDIPITDGYGRNRYAMIIDGPWKFAELSGAYPDFELGVVPMPEGKAGSIQVLGGEDIVMFRTAHKEESWEFMKFMTSEYAQKEMAKVGQIPVNEKIIQSKDITSIEKFAPFLTAIQTAKPRPAIAQWPQVDEQLNMAIVKAIMGDQTVKEALDEAAKKIDTILLQ